MPLVDLKEITKQFEAQLILGGVDFAIDQGEKIAIVGRNGSGKSTLMKIASGVLEPDHGTRMAQNGITIEMLDQSPILDESLSVREAIEQSLSELNNIKTEYERLSAELVNFHGNKELIAQLADLGNKLDFHNAWNLTDQIDRVLIEFDLLRLQNALIMTLSGGEKRRVALGALLLKKPDLLLLDEPTNHLDVYMVRFLENMLKESKSTLLIISHDRYFIDSIATRTIEIENGVLRSFKGGYNLYLEQKAQMLESMIKTHETLVKQLRGEAEWLNRGVKARLKRNVGRVERIKQMKEDAKKNPAIIKRVKLELEREQKAFNQTESINRKRMLFDLEKLVVGIDKQLLINPITTRVLQQDKIALVGRNGSGKTTLLLTLQKILTPLQGTLKIGAENIGFFDQHRIKLDDSKNLLETFCPNGGDHIDVRGHSMHVYGYMKNWLLPKEFLDKKIGVLSGGEKNRVALALLFSKKYDCLILDEPTNDLDIPTINILEEYLQSYQGALIFVSHDRYFVDKIAQKLWVIDSAHNLSEELRSYTEYLDDEYYIAELENLATENPKESKPEAKKQTTKFSYKEQKLYDELPRQITAIEEEIRVKERCMMDEICYNANGGLAALHESIQTLKTDLEAKVERYFELEERKQNGTY